MDSEFFLNTDSTASTSNEKKKDCSRLLGLGFSFETFTRSWSLFRVRNTALPMRPLVLAQLECSIGPKACAGGCTSNLVHPLNSGSGPCLSCFMKQMEELLVVSLRCRAITAAKNCPSLLSLTPTKSLRYRSRRREASLRCEHPFRADEPLNMVGKAACKYVLCGGLHAVPRPAAVYCTFQPFLIYLSVT